MSNNPLTTPTDRRRFLGSLATTAAVAGLATIAPSISTYAAPTDYYNEGDPDKWFDQIKGKHRIVYDVPEPHEIFPFAWAKVFLVTNEMTGTPAKDCSVVVVLRHSSIPYAMEDRLWAKYNFGEAFKINDPKTKAASVRNPFWKPAKGDFTVPGLGPIEIGINELQANGVMFCVCNMALTVNAAIMAEKMKMTAEEVKKDWMAGILPNVQVVPSGVWAVGRAQEHGCQYCFAG